MTEDEANVTVAICEAEVWHLGTALDADTALTLLALASEDPSCWDDMVSCWTRYRTPAVCEFIDNLPIAVMDRDAAYSALDDADAWLLIDLAQKRISTGRAFQLVGRDQAFAMVVDNDGQQHFPLSVHLPPWWELHEQVDAGDIRQPRQSPIQRPEVNREVLFGEPLLVDLAARVLAIVHSERWAQRDGNGQQPCYPFTVEVHRDWLMTPRDDLGGLTPRQMLHGGHEWIDRVVWGQQLRFSDSGEIVAAPEDVVGYETAPMGGEEVVVYFELCRELIAAAWSWCENDETQRRLGAGEDCRPALVEFLRGVKEDWLASPLEGGSPPRFIIECSRRRVPRGAGVPIAGMTGRQAEEHVIDCDCPICAMMSEGKLGVAFAGLDGHQLELDDEFAFSMHETREAWERQQREFEQMSAEFERKQAEREAAGEKEPDDFASAWSGYVSDEPLPGDRGGYLTLAFLLAEIVSVLQTLQAPHADIRQLNANFTDFRTCRPAELAEAGRRLGDHLDSLTERYPDIIPRVADFRSRIDERVRSQLIEDDREFPF